jgi:L-alanine-DL-glutamate epimerase-like enolase superfamily enzyme
VRVVAAAVQTFPIRGTFRISRGEKTSATVIEVTIEEDGRTGRGECVPYARYGQSIRGVLAEIDSVTPAIADGIDIDELQKALSPGPARNAVECALWDLRARQGAPTASGLLGPGRALHPLPTAYTISLDTPGRMASAAAEVAGFPLLKLKLGGEGDIERVRAVRDAAGEATLIADANESWSVPQLREFTPRLRELGVELVEQPLPAEHDAFLAEFDSPVPLSADESCHDRSSIPGLVGKYDYVTVKLDKTGGLVEALQVLEAAKAAGLRTMVGCMVATSLSMAPGIIAAHNAEVVHLDGPLLLARDREPGLRYDGALVHPPTPEVWHG